MFHKYLKTATNKKRIMLVLIFMSFSIGMWSNYRQLWLQNVGFNIGEVSSLISIGLFGSCFLSIIVSLFSTKVRIKEVLVLSSAISIISMLGLLFMYKSTNIVLIKTFVLLTIITEYLFWIGIYPLFTTVEKSGEIFEKKVIVQNFCVDFAILAGGICIGINLGNIILDSNFCLLLSIIFSMFALGSLLSINYEDDKYNKIKTKEFRKVVKIIIKNKMFLIYFLYVCFVNTAWDIIVGLQIILFTSGFALSENISSTIILILGIIATLLAVFTAKKVKFKNSFTACLIKYLSRVIIYFLVFLTGNIYIAIIAFGITIITSRMLSNDTDGIYINLADNDLQFMFSNIRFIALTFGETIGLFLAGYLFGYGIKIMFLVSMVFYILVLICCYILNRLYKK